MAISTKAIETLKSFRTIVPDMEPQYLANIIESSLRTIERKEGEKLYDFLEETRTLARYRAELKTLKAQVQKSANDKKSESSWTRLSQSRQEEKGPISADAMGTIASTKPTDQPLPRPSNNASTPKPEKMVIVKDADDAADARDYGPIPDVTYKWFDGAGNENPQQVDFQMANGAKIELMPLKKGVFYMPNGTEALRAYHKVTLTRPFWMSKFCVTSTQWREFDEAYVADCLPIEKALEGKYPLSKRVTRAQFDAFCKFLTQKYRRQIPEGYVFRLPSDAEWIYAFDEESFFLALQA